MPTTWKVLDGLISQKVVAALPFIFTTIPCTIRTVSGGTMGGTHGIIRHQLMCLITRQVVAAPSQLLTERTGNDG